MPREKAMSFLGFSDDDGGDGALTGMELPFPGAGTGVFIPTPALSVATVRGAALLNVSCTTSTAWVFLLCESRVVNG